MLIECPFCHAQARIADSKEGARVRCGQCEKVYTAREPGRRKRTGTQGTSIAIFIAVGVLALIALVIVRRQGSEPAPLPSAVATEEAAPEPVDRSGWESAPVVAARQLFEAAEIANRDVLRRRLASGSAPTAASGAPAGEAGAWPALGLDERVVALATGTGEMALAIRAWKPFDGEVVAESDDRARVRLQVAGRDPQTAAETRVLELRLALEDGDWTVVDWERYFTPPELEALEAAARAAARAQVETVELSDGSVVRESEPGPIPFADDTPEAQRGAITEDLARLVDFELDPRDNADAKARLVEHGAPALPALLTAVFELPLETPEDAMKLNLVNQCLEEITGHHTGFKPQIFEGSATGTTEERRESALRQWFAWWHSEGHRFEGRPEPEAEQEPPSEAR